MMQWRAGGTMSAAGGRRLYLRTLDGKLLETMTGGTLRRSGGWIYGEDERRQWAVPESSVAAIMEER